jgi:LEA14-like dessication related protein
MTGENMIAPRLIALSVLAVAPLALDGCATLQPRDPLQVTIAGVEPLQGEGMELRLLVKLRVQNPNDAPIDYNGASVEMIVQGRTFATGVSDATGIVPRFGESVVEVPVTASAFRMLTGAVDMFESAGNGKITYEMRGKLNSSSFSSVHFKTQGEFDLSAAASPTNQAN